MTAEHLSEKKRGKKCRTCGGSGEMSLSPLGRKNGVAIMPMVTCTNCDGIGRESISLKPYISPARMADGRDTL